MLWRGLLALVVIIGALGMLISVVNGSIEGTIGGAAIAAVGGAFSFWRIQVHDRASSRPTPP